MNEITLFNANQIQSASIDELKQELSRTLKVTSEYLVYMSLIWSELNKRGVDLSALRSGLFEYVPLIATNQLNPDLVIEFAGNKTLISALSRIPLEQQNWIAKTKQVPFVEIGENQERIEKSLDLTKAKAQQIYQVFGGETGFRDVNQQYVLLVNKETAKQKRKTTGRTAYRTVGFSQNREYMLFGDDAKIKLDTVIDRLGELYNVDLHEILSRYSNELKNKK
ncbi:hypothetical protein [Acinetobacter brisouii]|uniref:hypothetical protein n=1 Tax=Acinetobacter brisouii TaxID=396323 RepID=UPI00125028C1|nr:hypothetical protein [Acinetobacter brisouii]